MSKEERARKRQAVAHLAFPCAADRSGNNRALLSDQWTLAPVDAPITHVLDIGAHIGTFTCYAAEFWQRAAILAVEPDAGNMAFLEANTKHLSTVRRMLAGMGDGTPIAFLGKRRRSSSICYGPAPSSPAATVPSRTLHQLVADVGFSNKPGERLLIKIDAEGAEWGFLTDTTAAEALRSCEAFVIDIHGHDRRRFVQWATEIISTHSVSVCRENKFGTNVNGFRKETTDNGI